MAPVRWTRSDYEDETWTVSTRGRMPPTKRPAGDAPTGEKHPDEEEAVGEERPEGE